MDKKEGIVLRWSDDKLTRIEIEVRDGKAPVRMVYPKLEDCDEREYDCKLDEFFSRIRTFFAKTYGNLGVYGPYGIFTDNSALLAGLVLWQNNDEKVQVEEISSDVRRRIAEMIKEMVLGWDLSIKDHKCSVDKFVGYVVDNSRWLFDFNVSAKAKSLFNINKDALELEWYVINDDRVNSDKKFMTLVDNLGLNMARRCNALINAHVHLFAMREMLAEKERHDEKETAQVCVDLPCKDCRA